MLLLDFLEIFISIHDTLVNFLSVAHVVFSSEHHELDEVYEGNYNVDPVGWDLKTQPLLRIAKLQFFCA